MTKTGRIYSIVKKIVKVAAISVLSLLALLTVLSITIPVIWPNYIFAVLENKDTIRTMGNGKFEIGDFNDHIGLVDNRFNGSRILVNTIEKYSIENDHVYIIGDYRGGGWNDYWDIKTGKQKFYNENNLIPRYLTLNTETEELKTYIELVEIPEPDRAIFEKLQKEVQ